MGNCLKTCVHGQRGERKEGEEEKDSGVVKENDFCEGSGMRIKIVLRKEELERLLIQLKDKEGKRLEDVLEELEKGRGKAVGWKPSLESIMESHGVERS